MSSKETKKASKPTFELDDAFLQVSYLYVSMNESDVDAETNILVLLIGNYCTVCFTKDSESMSYLITQGYTPVYTLVGKSLYVYNWRNPEMMQRTVLD